MSLSLINDKSTQIRLEDVVTSNVTSLTIIGSIIEIKGYVSIEGLNPYWENRIRKVLMIIPRVDVDLFRRENEDYIDLSDKEIIELYTKTYILDSCRVSEVYESKGLKLEELKTLSGFKGEINLSTVNEGKPLWSGDYDIFIKLEQLTVGNGSVKYKKVIPILNVPKFMKEGIFTTNIQYPSSDGILKYNLVASHDDFSQTLRFENSLLQSSNPQDMTNECKTEEGRYIKAIKRKFFRLCYKILCIFPVDKNKVVFASDSRSELNGNFYFVYEELYKRNLNLKVKFILSERIDNKKTFLNLLKIAYQFATSKVILLDDFYPMIYPLKVRKGVELIQVWHAAGAFKAFGYSQTEQQDKRPLDSRNHKNYTKVVVSSESVREHYAKGFGVTVDKVYPTGVPRSDIFFDDEYKSYVKNTLQSKYPFLKNKKVILFAPTFRGSGQSSAYYPFENLNLNDLYNELHTDYVFLFKMHPFVKDKVSIPREYTDFFYDFSDYREINDLLLVTDILITDYSSVCFEYALLNKPILFFAFDVEEYILERGFYYDYFDFIPGPLLKTTSGIIKIIKEERFELEKLTPFVNYFFDGTLGRASKNVVDQLIIPNLKYTRGWAMVKERILPTPISRKELFNRSIK